MTFTRWLVDEWKKEWDSLMCSISQIHLNDEQDKVGWVFGSKNSFFVKSIYNNLTSNESGLYHKKIWKGKILAKIKIFLWLILNDSILTKDNMLKRNRHGDPTCCFCRTDESALHLECNVAKTIWVILAKSIGVDDIPRSLSHAWSWPEKWLPNGQKFHTLRIAAICWAIWKTRNKAWFEGTILHNPVTIVSHTCALIKYWAGLYPEEEREMVEAGVNTMLEITKKLVKKTRVNQKALEDGSNTQVD